MSARFDARVAAAAKVLGMSAPGRNLLLRPISRDLNLLATAPVLEPGLRPLEGNVVMTGPCLPQPVADDDPFDTALEEIPGGVDVIYVSLGTVFNAQTSIYRKLIAGAASAGAYVVVSAGASFDALVAIRSATVRIHRRVPQLALLKRVRWVITHGGNNTVQECLVAGRPMVVVPFGGDQIVNAHRVERLGVGVRLDAARLAADSVRTALATLDDHRVEQRALQLSLALKGYKGTCLAVDTLLAEVASRPMPDQ